MRPTRLTPPGSTIHEIRTPIPEAPSEDLDAPAYNRGPTSFPEFQRSQAMHASDRMDAGNRTFNQQFMATMASEAGGSPNGIDLTRLTQWVSGFLGRNRSGGAPPADYDNRKW